MIAASHYITDYIKKNLSFQSCNVIVLKLFQDFYCSNFFRLFFSLSFGNRKVIPLQNC